MRTKKSIKNILSVLIFNIIIGILGLIKARVFINGLNNDIYSLNQLFYQIFSYIAIADIGFALIINKNLYKSISLDDKDEINKIYSTAKKFFKYIGIFMLLISFVLSFFIDKFTKANVSVSYMQIIFMVFIFRNVIDYFFIAPRCVLEADQKLYKVNHIVRFIKILETIVEIILVLIGCEYLIVLIPGIFITIILDIYINKKIYKEYPWLKDEKSFDKKYLKGTKEVIWQKLSGLVSSNTDIILISTYINPISVIIYTSYNYICKYLIDTIYILSNAIIPSFANLLHKESDEKKYNVFTEINIFFLFVASFVMIMLYGFLTPLISFWMGYEYTTTSIILFLFCFITFQKIADRPMIMIINSYGIFKETKIPIIVEAILNLVISFLLINKLGIAGVLIGTVVSKLLITTINYPMYIMKNVFNKKSLKYLMQYFLIIIINLIFVLLFKLISVTPETLYMWLIYVLVFSVIVMILLFIIYYILFKSFRNLLNRIIEFIKVRGKYSE